MSFFSRISSLKAEAGEFAPGLHRMNTAPSPLPRAVIVVLAALLGALILWAWLGRLDVVAVANGRLIPLGQLKVVQPPESGIVTELLVREGDRVETGQVLMRMDPLLNAADQQSVGAEFRHRALQLRRIEAELAGAPLKTTADDPPELAEEFRRQLQANRQAFHDTLAQEQASLERARQNLAAAEAVREKLDATLPSYKASEEAFNRLAKDGFAGNLVALDRQRLRIEREQDLRAQEHTLASLRAEITQSERRLREIDSQYRQQLLRERSETLATHQKLEQEVRKLSHRGNLLELRAPSAGIVKDLATHTAGTVVSPGTVLLTVVPEGEPLVAEVWLDNEDIGFVRQGQDVQIKLAAFPFQKYGMAAGTVRHVSPDATDPAKVPGAAAGARGAPLYRTLVEPAATMLNVDGKVYPLGVGMQVTAEIRIAERSVLEYLASPVRGAFHDAARER
ncbi:HlyD family type I secretion periplasmic adaptor subunit [Aromatoleum diolicum]|uniref:Membrane fusion protein (MFP) family protein n=1 Tax=Aromatoleum diolicum TaxID=75796 RepID=A0ABX1QFI8_9RHOO|nr:HlyD family type I secretion periplasmic adaptor subunit [Aromatoleum diolicum]NMG77209.1 HlyD family type I secretion periplasmic adaptor subunit [Aromatoleum diolicum]